MKMLTHSGSRRFAAAALLFFACALALLLPGKAYANAPVPSYFFEIDIANAPAEAVGLDFLFPKDKIPEDEYTDCFEEGLASAGLSTVSELASFDLDGYVSLLAHDTDSYYGGELTFWDGSGYQIYQGQTLAEGTEINCYGYASCYHLLTKGSTSSRIALFDREGHVLAVSDPFLPERSTPRQFFGHLIYDAAEGTVSAEIPDDDGKDSSIFKTILMVIGFLLAAGLAVILAVFATVGGTMLIEFIIALLFHLRPAAWVLLVNFVSNIIFNIFLAAFCFFRSDPVPYMTFIPIGEVVVILAEYLIYRKIYTTVPKKRLLAYTVTANLCSMLLIMALSGIFF